METNDNIDEYVSPNERKEEERSHIFEIISSIKSGPEQRTCLAISKWLLKNLFWSVIYLAGTYLTIRSCWNLCQDYAENQTTISMTASTGNGIKLPNITICIPLNLAEMFPLTSTSETPYSDAMNEFFAKYTVDGKLQFRPPHNWTLPTPMDCANSMNGPFWSIASSQVFFNFPQSDLVSFETLFVLQKYLAMLYKAENLQDYEQNPFINLSDHTSDDYKALLDILVPKITELNISMNEIMSIFVEYFQLYPFYYMAGLVIEDCLKPYAMYSVNSSQLAGADVDVTYLFFSINYISKQGSVIETDWDNLITYWDENQICVTVDALNKALQYNPAKTNNAELQISFNDWSHPIAYGHLSVDFNGSNTPPDDTKIGSSNKIYALGLREKASNTISVQFVIHSLSRVNGEERCSMIQTRQECEVGCRRALIQKFCGCSPITLQKYTTEVSTEKEQKCTFTHYENCLNYSGKEDEECRTKCLDSCEYWQYDISLPSNDYSCDSDPVSECSTNPTKIDISIGKFDFLIFQESYQWTLSDFIAALSGALGFCFGINFVDLIQFVCNLLTIVTGKLQTVLKLNTDEETSETVDQQNMVHKLKKILAFFNIEGPAHGNWLSIIKWLVKMFFWAGIYSAGTIITAIFCKNLIEQYQSNLMYTSLTVNYNTSYSLPPATLCFPFSPEFFTIKQGNFSTVYFSISSLKGYFSSTNVTEERFMQQNNGSTWPLEMIYMVSYYLSFLYQEETSVSAVDFVSDVHDFLTFDIDTDGDFSEALNEILPQLDQWNVTTDQLRQKLGFELKEILNFSVTYGDSITRISLNNTSTVAIIRSSYISFCLRLPLDTVEFTSTKDYLEIVSLLPNSWLSDESSDVTATLDFGGAPFSIPTCLFTSDFTLQNCDFAMNNPSVFSDLSLRINFIINNDRGNPDAPQCSIEETQETCQARSRIKLIEKICNCSPTTWPTLLSPTSKECSWNDYLGCLKYSGTEDLADVNKCLPSCQIITFDSSTSSTTDITTTLANIETMLTYFRTGRWRIFIDDFTYPSLEPLPQMTFFEFIAAFGGTLGVILALDLRLFPWSLFAPIFAMFTFVLKRKKNKNFLIKPEKHKVFLRVVNSQALKKIASIFDFSLLSVKKMSRFAIIRHSVYYIFWSVVYITGGSLTFYVCWPLFLDYKNDKLTASVQLCKNSSFFLPSPTVCLPVFLLNKSHHNEEGEATDIVFQKYFQNSTETLLNSNWDSPLLGIVQMYISKYGNFEMPDPEETILATNVTEKLFETFVTLDMNMNFLNITLEQLKQKFGNEIRKQIAIEISFFQNNTLINGSVHELEIVFVSESKICYKIDTDFIEFKSAADFLKIYINGEKIFSGYCLDDNCPSILYCSYHWCPLIKLPSFGTVTVDLEGRNVVTNRSAILDGTIPLSFGENITATLEILSVIQGLPTIRGTHVCAEKQTQYDCQNQCLIQAILNHCKCAPRLLKLTTLLNDMEKCSLNEYGQCFALAFNDSQQCWKNCLPSCEMVRFGLIVNSSFHVVATSLEQCWNLV